VETHRSVEKWWVSLEKWWVSLSLYPPYIKRPNFNKIPLFFGVQRFSFVRIEIQRFKTELNN